MEKELTQLTKADLNAIEVEVAMLTGDEPTLETLINEGYNDHKTLNAVLDFIAGAGRVITLFAAELIQSLAALILLIVFAMLEYQRVEHGAVALGQTLEAAQLIAFAVVVANVVHPIYSLRQLRGQAELIITKSTARGYAETFLHRVIGKPETETVDLYHNPTLHLAAMVITWSTILLAVYDILGPLLKEIFSTTGLTKAPEIAIMELIMGAGLSIAGVFFLQSAAHEIGVRTLTDQPQRLTDVLEKRRAEHAEYVSSVRDEVRSRRMAAKLAESQRKAAQKLKAEPPRAEDDTEPVNPIQAHS